MSRRLHKVGDARHPTRGGAEESVGNGYGKERRCVMANILLARQPSADEVSEGQERRDGKESLGARRQSRRLQMRHLPREPLHTTVRELDEQLSLRPWRGWPQQWECPSVKRMRRIDDGHLTSRGFRY